MWFLGKGNGEGVWEKEKQEQKNQELADQVVQYLKKKDNGQEKFTINYRQFNEACPGFLGDFDAQKLVYHRGYLMFNYFGRILVKLIPIPDPKDTGCFFIH